MYLWVFLIVIIVIAAIVLLSVSLKDHSSFPIFDFITPLLRLGVIGLTFIACLLIYICHLKGCLNQQFFMTSPETVTAVLEN